MSDPVTNAEVEDVLSSIRRLVSEDKRPLQASKSEPKNDRLVLTPALRVAENNAPDDRLAGPSAAADGMQDTIFDDDEDDVEDIDTFSSLDEEEGDTGLDTSLDDLITDDGLLDVYPREEMAKREAEDEEEADEEARFDDFAQDYSADPYNFDDDDDIDGEGTEIFLTTPADRDEGHRDLDGVQAGDFQQMDSNAQAEVIGEDFDDEVEAAQDVSVEAEASQQTAPDAEKPSPATTDADQQPSRIEKSVTLSAKIEALETAIGNIADTWEPDDPGESDYAGTEPETMEWEDDEPEPQKMERPQFVHATAVFAPRAQASAQKPEKEVSSAPTLEREATSASPEPPEEREIRSTASQETASAADPAEVDLGRDLSDDEQLIDEEALRDLVSDIVRQELQGALGERITRNVRKLVRREIHRALTAQELE